MTHTLLSTHQVARRLGKSTRTVHRLVQSHQLVPVAQGPGERGAYLFDPARIDQFAATQLPREEAPR